MIDSVGRNSRLFRLDSVGNTPRLFGFCAKPALFSWPSVGCCMRQYWLYICRRSRSALRRRWSCRMDHRGPGRSSVRAPSIFSRRVCRMITTSILPQMLALELKPSTHSMMKFTIDRKTPIGLRFLAEQPIGCGILDEEDFANYKAGRRFLYAGPSGLHKQWGGTFELSPGIYRVIAHNESKDSVRVIVELFGSFLPIPPITRSIHLRKPALFLVTPRGGVGIKG